MLKKDKIKHNLEIMFQSIRNAEIKYHRATQAVALLVVSKKQPIEKIRDAFLAGQTAFGESYVQEAIAKQKALHDLSIEWHFIGTIQSNKTKLIAHHFDWVHSVNRYAIAEQLNTHRPSNLSRLNICIEVNIDQDETKFGVNPNDVLSLATKITSLKNLALRGLMVIPRMNNSEAAFEKTAALQKELMQAGLAIDTLSMGMSADFDAAIKSGSTIVRIGTAIFGERKQDE
ncbi:MAG: YggS family pyridoxal phosphate-dependent enzyme [Gammaproteobacteria bacterium CG_4_10_14_0_8_um_filter_38_16]|nr:MAG: YggS family pyridoxal phosphate-dependent enzyme [Gammaproteobacteria bacterium CG_4_10_14_0_8_um_filter_38_16]PJA03224.1 MAG: YggS family pyridoxal phosphate-dependent enzyme [Gammaproteobacteria bacterium CG_4_10_14_0_2_um_filter_38_22]PJB10904.1 MAG: YggS family pyridoxal phosphate-dependent enzyme [Gammaproteobacteria bacterium CG_4_9_14_3_um_filter_38_9]